VASCGAPQKHGTRDSTEKPEVPRVSILDRFGGGGGGGFNLMYNIVM